MTVPGRKPHRHALGWLHGQNNKTIQLHKTAVCSCGKVFRLREVR